MSGKPSAGVADEVIGSNQPLPPGAHAPFEEMNEPDARPSYRRFALAGSAAGAVTVAGAVAGGGTFVSNLPGAWFFGTPGGPLGSAAASGRHATALAILAVYGGLVAMAVLWWKLAAALRNHPGTPVARVLGVLAVWAVPFLLAPPLFSRDVYSYAGQGAMVTFHINPYLYGPGVLGATPFNILAGPLWANTPSPYGPTFLSLDGLATAISGHQVLLDLVLLRLLEVCGVALLAAGIPTLARRAGRDPAAAVVLGAGSPLVLATLIGGEHNDALMVGLLVAGLAVWQRYGPVPGVVLCALAAGVKFPAALGVILIGWNWPGPGAQVATRIWRTLAALGIGAVTLGVVSAVSGIGWGWLQTASAPDKVFTGVTPVDAVSKVVAGVLHLVGAGVPLSSVRAVGSVVGVVAAVAVGTWLLWHSPRLGAVRALGLALLALALLSPVLWAWYVTWGLVVLAPVAAGRLRRVVIGLSAAEALIGAASVEGVLKSLADAGPFAAVLVVVGVVAAGRLAAYALTCSPWSAHRATHPAGVTVTGIQRPQIRQ
jgi:alpha-1,6-mannosyltransferase